MINAYVESGATIVKGPLQKCTTRLYARHRPGNSQSGGVQINLDSKYTEARKGGMQKRDPELWFYVVFT